MLVISISPHTVEIPQEPRCISQIEETVIEETIEEYPNAAYVWDYFTEQGYSAEAIAGMLGNMMTECGNNTLHLQSQVTNPTSGRYGICQWIPRYHESVINTDLGAQCEYLATNIVDYFYYYGDTYGYTLEEFKSISDVTTATEIFQRVYERGDEYTIQLTMPDRVYNASIAYAYFAEEPD